MKNRFYNFDITDAKMKMAKTKSFKMSVRYFWTSILYGFLIQTMFYKIGTCEFRRRQHG